MFYSYTAPAPPGLEKQLIHPGSYSTELSEFIFPYDDLRRSAYRTIHYSSLCRAPMKRAQDLANWDRAELERSE